jgi:hypothetical protein
VSPAAMDRWKESGWTRLKKFARAATPKIEKALPYAITVGLLLPTMHQSSLGSLMLLAGTKLHPLWQTPLLPLLFLVSCVAMGFAGVTAESLLASRAFRRPSPIVMLRRLAFPAALVMSAYVVLRGFDIVWRGQLEAAFRMDWFSLLFLGEMALLAIPAVALLAWGHRGGAVLLALAATAALLGGALYRFSSFLIAFDPGPEWSYFPSGLEILVSVGLISGQILVYVLAVKLFPVLRGAPPVAIGAGQAGTTWSEIGESDLMEVEVGSGSATQTLPAMINQSSTNVVVGPAGKPKKPSGIGPAGAIVILALLGSVAELGAQSAANRPDLRCLTSKEEHCLAEPMSREEPHGAVCATCHDLWAQPRLSDAAKTCASSGCHTDVESLTPFHQGLNRRVAENCIGCHPAHDVRIPGGGANCNFCHEAGGQHPVSARDGRRGVRRPVSRAVTFEHVRHRSVECTDCHTTGVRHTELRVDRIQDCRSCHHTEQRVAKTCDGCHTNQQVRFTRQVTRTLKIDLGSLVRPRRTLPFDHGQHLSLDCFACHPDGSAARRPAEANCSSCHEQHHRPTANCLTCHETPRDATHTREAHLGCGGVGCHENAALAIRDAPRTRSICVTCHTDRVTHEVGSNCSDCHQLPKPRQWNRVAGLGR